MAIISGNFNLCENSEKDLFYKNSVHGCTRCDINMLYSEWGNRREMGEFAYLNVFIIERKHKVTIMRLE